MAALGASYFSPAFSAPRGNLEVVEPSYLNYFFRRLLSQVVVLLLNGQLAV